MDVDDPTEASEETPRSIWPRLSILLIGVAAFGLLLVMCLVVALVAYLRG